MNNSKFLGVSLHDFFKGVILAILTAICTPIYNYLESGGDPLQYNWHQCLGLALTAFVGYTLKQVLTNSEGKLFTKEPNQ